MAGEMKIYVQYFKSHPVGYLSVIEKIATVSTVPLGEVRSDWFSQSGSRYSWRTFCREFEVDDAKPDIYVRILTVYSGKSFSFDEIEVWDVPPTEPESDYPYEEKIVTSSVKLNLHELVQEQVCCYLNDSHGSVWPVLGYHTLSSVYPDFWTRTWSDEDIAKIAEIAKDRRTLMTSIRCLPGRGVDYLQAGKSWHKLSN